MIYKKLFIKNIIFKVNKNKRRNVPCATPSLRGVEFFSHGKRGEREGAAQGTILLLFLFINCKNAATACQVETALSSCNLLPELL